MPDAPTEASSKRDQLRKPIFVSIKEACDLLSISRGGLYLLFDSEQIETRYQGRRRLVVLSSLEEFAEGLPTEREVG